ncbi:hypothetical protein L228DRAFT_261357 [Xylona heveae TC161]|uniref:Uncharacterized protein n=1 Tax=Xylona heveae (strain CBS 132557 / TC161) TaxID=1328760 RepID=A0A165GG82_XYLHT|nr:hypothetical protein L228DRAFT_261357 [Xylona heveae TC161]KZF22144.1 hypothetical protein L228DRAFT_261357 [Xylona heveae TC161]
MASNTITIAAASSVGSDVFAVLSLLVISLGVLLLLRHYLPLRSTPDYLLVPIFLALALPASIILLVPIDLASSSRDEEVKVKAIWLPERVVLVSWRITYWLTFALTWFILPLLGSYADSGHRTLRDRFLYSLRENGRYQLIVLGSASIGLVYFFVQSGFHLMSLKGLVMALAYCWALTLAIYLMGHGLVALPRRLLRNASISGRLRRLQIQAPKVYDRLNDAIEELGSLELQVEQLRRRKTGSAVQFHDWIDELAEMSTLPESRVGSAPTGILDPAGSSIPSVITERYLADLTRKLQRARHARVRFIDEWDHLVEEAADTQAILDAHTSHRLEFGKSSPSSSFLSRLTLLTPYTRFQLHAHIIPYIRLMLGTFLSLASISIIWSELVKIANPKLSIIALTVVHHRRQGTVGFAGQCIASAWLLYMCTAALTSISDAKVWGNRALVRRNTYGESACWYAMQIAKLTVPLAYNFVTFLPPEIYQETTYHKFLGRLINLTPLGKGFDYFFPILILIPVLATLFNLYGKIKNLFGFGILEVDDQGEEGNLSGYGTGGWREGRELIERELQGYSSTQGIASRSAGLSNYSSGRTAGTTGTADGGGAQAGRPGIGRPNTGTSLRVQDRYRDSDDPNRRDSLEDEGFFEGFAHRVRNTFETTDTPRWVSNLGESFKKPKWLASSSSTGHGEGGGSSGNQGGGLARWFGGRPTDGHVRL